MFKRHEKFEYFLTIFKLNVELKNAKFVEYLTLSESRFLLAMNYYCLQIRNETSNYVFQTAISLKLYYTILNVRYLHES